MKEHARLLLALHPLAYDGEDIDEFCRRVDRVREKVSLLETLARAGWTIELVGIEEGVCDYAAVHEFASPLEANDAAAALGAEGRPFEWPGEREYLYVNDDRQWIVDNYEGATRLTSQAD